MDNEIAIELLRIVKETAALGSENKQLRAENEYLKGLINKLITKPTDSAIIAGDVSSSTDSTKPQQINE